MEIFPTPADRGFELAVLAVWKFVGFEVMRFWIDGVSAVGYCML
jgi:hypothetical protein